MEYHYDDYEISLWATINQYRILALYFIIVSLSEQMTFTITIITDHMLKGNACKNGTKSDTEFYGKQQMQNLLKSYTGSFLHLF